jgi:hypothetical protein
LSLTPLETCGFTATRELSEMQRYDVCAYLDNLDYGTYVTGGCRGGDAVIGAHLAMTQPAAIHRVYVPSDLSQVDAWWDHPIFATQSNIHVVWDCGTYRERNTRIVSSSEVLEVFAQYREDDPRSKRSGTWMTKRIARNRHVPSVVHILSEAWK